MDMESSEHQGVIMGFRLRRAGAFDAAGDLHTGVGLEGGGWAWVRGVVGLGGEWGGNGMRVEWNGIVGGVTQCECLQ